MKAEVKNGTLYYRDLLFKKELPIADIRWVYIQKEDINSKLCCGSYNMEITRVIVIDKDGRKVALEYEQNDPAREILAKISDPGSHILVGYTDENKAKMGM